MTRASRRRRPRWLRDRGAGLGKRKDANDRWYAVYEPPGQPDIDALFEETERAQGRIERYDR